MSKATSEKTGSARCAEIGEHTACSNGAPVCLFCGAVMEQAEVNRQREARNPFALMAPPPSAPAAPPASATKPARPLLPLGYEVDWQGRTGVYQIVNVMGELRCSCPGFAGRPGPKGFRGKERCSHVDAAREQYEVEQPGPFRGGVAVFPVAAAARPGCDDEGVFDEPDSAEFTAMGRA